jgi:solute carrier family 13 (sodium-dependent dicarboxylate transporter), member 2/3/5
MLLRGLRAVLPIRPSTRFTLRPLVLLLGAAGAVLCWSGALAPDLPAAARATLGVTSLAVGLWASELVAMPVTALLAMTLLFISGATPRLEQALTGFQSPVLFFLLGSAGLGIAAEQTGLTERLAAWLLGRARGSGRRLLGELLLSLPVQALVVPSAISRNAVLVPVYARVLARLGHPPKLGAAVMLALGVLGPLASSALLTGGTSSVAAAQALGGFTWVGWLVALAPPYYLLIALAGVLLWLVARPEPAIAVTADAERDAMPGAEGRLRASEVRVALISFATSALWILDWLTGWPPAVPALLALGALLLPGVGVIGWPAFAARAPWGICLVLAAAVSLADALTRTGAATWVGQALFGWVAAPASAAQAALVVFAVAALITLAIPNRAAAITLLIPLAGVYVEGGPLSVAAAGLVVMIAVDVETLYPAQTAANLLAYERGYVNAGLLFRYNLLTLLLAGLVVALVAVPWWQLVGLPAGP